MTTNSKQNLRLRRGRWYVAFTVAGVTTLRSLKTRDLVEARRRAKPYLAEAERLRAAQLLGAPGRVWDEAVNRWRVTDFDSLHPSTRTRYETSVTILNRTFGGKLLKDITAPPGSTILSLRAASKKLLRPRSGVTSAWRTAS